MPKVNLSPFQRLVADWRDCERCELCQVRKQVVFVRGSLPCDVLLIGEAPGEAENILGAPFKGPAGKLLDYMIEEARYEVTIPFTIAFCNLIGCIPKGEDRKKSEPTPKEIEACRPRLQKIIELANPSVVVCVKAIGDRKVEVFPIIHPAFVLHADKSQKGLLTQKTIINLVEAFQAIIPF